jgi:hypothetical protein
MPFELKKVSTRGWKVVDDKGREYSRKPLTKKRATAQLRALYASYNDGGFKEIKGGYIVKHNGEDHTLLYGEGFFSDIFDKVKNIASSAVNAVRRITTIRRDYPPNVRAILQQYGNGTIVGLAVRREPIKSFINTALNWITRGSWDKAKREANYDNMFHLGLVVDVELNGEVKRFLIEKNEVINITTSFSQSQDIQMLIIQPPQPPITLNQMLDSAKNAMGENFFLYDAFKNNCQNFIMGLLENSGLMTPTARQFILQPINELIKGLPSYTPIVARALTDIAGVANRVIYGEGGSCCASCSIGRACKGANGGRTITTQGGVRLKAKAVLKGSAYRPIRDYAVPAVERTISGGADRIITDESRLAELQSIIPTKAKWEASFKRRGATPTQTYEEWRKGVEEINKKRALRNLDAEARATAEIEGLKERQKKWAEEVANNPDLGQVACKYDEAGTERRTTTSKGQCRQNHAKHFEEWEKKNHPANAYFFRPAVNALANLTGKLAEVVPGIPQPLRDLAKPVVEGALRANSYEPTERGSGLKEMCGGSIASQLKMLKIPMAKYLSTIREAGEREGYDPKTITLAKDGEHKIAVKAPDGTVRYAGRVGYGDFHIYSILENKGEVAKGTATEKQKSYRSRATKIKGDWKSDKYSPNSLAIALLW